MPKSKQAAPTQEQIAKAPEREVAPKQELVAERKAVVAPIEKVYPWPEHERHWVPLNNAVTAYESRQFAWKVETGTLQTYQHMETHRVLHIDGLSGQFYRQDGNPITAKEAMDHAMPTGQSHSHSQDVAQQVKAQEKPEQEQSIGRGHGMGM